MPTLYLVRHARPAAGWGEDPDPGLDDTGALQARATAADLAKATPPLHIYSSPLRRCRETAQPLEAAWRQPASVLNEVAEIPTPPLDMASRREWLMRAMGGTWQELQQSAPAGSVNYPQWRGALVSALMQLPHDCVIFSHFIAINVAVAAARGDDAVVCFRPDHASVTVLEARPDGLKIARLGREADTSVLTR